MHPRFTCEDDLIFISDETGWWNLYRLEESGPRNLCKKEEEFGLPHWIFGYTTYQPHPTNTDCLVATHGKVRTKILSSCFSLFYVFVPPPKSGY